MLTLQKTTLSFTASTASAPISADLILGIQTPASFGASSITLLYCETVDGTYLPVYTEAGTTSPIGISNVDATNAAFYDLSNIFPLALQKINNVTCGYIKFRASTSITKNIIVYTGGK